MKRKVVIDKGEQAKMAKTCKKPNYGPNCSPATRTEATKEDVEEQNVKDCLKEAPKVVVQAPELNVEKAAVSKSNPSRRESEVSETLIIITNGFLRAHMLRKLCCSLNF